MESITVSVIMSVFNDERFLVDSIESILKQSYKSFEFIIIDDASTDRSSEILKKYARIDKRIKVLTNKENLGLTKNLNVALQISTGKYIARMDSDDVSQKDRIKKQVDYMDNNEQVDICGTWAYRIGESGKLDVKLKRPVTNKKIKKRMLCGNPLIHPSIMIRREVLDTIQYDESYRSLQDYKLWVDSYNRMFHNIPEYLLLYRNNSNGISRKGKKKKSTRLKYDEGIKKVLLNERLRMNLSDDEISLYVKTINCIEYFDSASESEQALKVVKQVIKVGGRSNIIPLYSRWARTNKRYVQNKPIESLFGYICWLVEGINIIMTPLDYIRYIVSWGKADIRLRGRRLR